MKFIDKVKTKYASYLIESAEKFIVDANLSFEEIRIVYRFISDYLLKDCREEDCE